MKASSNKEIKSKIILAGGSGFLGQALALFYANKGVEVVILSRRIAEKSIIPNVRTVIWDGETLGDWMTELEGASAVINMAGKSVNCRYTKSNKAKIMSSRVLSTRVLADAINQCKNPPAVWLNSSTATIYKHTLGAAHDELGETGSTPEAQDVFSVEVARSWEKTFISAQTPDTRKVILRTAVVLGKVEGSAYNQLRMLAKIGLGGKMAKGNQWFSWIHLDDFCRATEWLIDQPESEGVYNISAPNPIKNEELMAVIRRAVGAKIGLPATKLMLEVGMFVLRTEPELVIKSRNVIPGRLLSEGFRFAFSNIYMAIAFLER